MKEIMQKYDRWCTCATEDSDLTVELQAIAGQEAEIRDRFYQELAFGTDKTVILCGPPIMIKFTLEALMEMGFDKKQIYTTLEMRMKCGIGKCGRCNVGSKYICKDGPVFRFDELDELPDEY